MCQTKVFRGDMKSLNPLELAKTPKEIQPANEHYLQRLRLIFNSHPTGNDFGNYPGIADYQLETEGGIELPKAGKLGVSIVDGSGGVRIRNFSARHIYCIAVFLFDRST
jgi:hypothetical protein